jgi:hypothetical protein
VIDYNHDEAVDSVSFVFHCVCCTLSERMVLGKNVKSELFFLIVLYCIETSFTSAALETGEWTCRTNRLVRHIDPCISTLHIVHTPEVYR